MIGVETVLAVYPNAIGFGFAVVTDDVLNPLDCGVISIKPIDNVACISKVQMLIEKFKTSSIIVQSLEGKHSHKTNRVVELIEGIEILSITRGLKLHKYSREQIRFVFEQFEAKSKQEIAQALVEAIPHYAYRLPEPRKPWLPEHYNMGMFDALSLMLTHSYLTQ